MLIDHDYSWLRNHESGWQFGETGVLAAIADTVELPNNWAVEFGVGNDVTCAGLVGWNRLLIDSEKVTGGGENYLRRKVAIEGPDSIDAIMAEHGVPLDPAVMIVDVDGLEWHIVRAMKSRPAILCVEHMDAWMKGTPIERFVPLEEECGRTLAGFLVVQANAAAVSRLIESMGYAWVWSSRVNGIYVRREYAKQLRRGPEKVSLGSCAVRM